MTSGILLVRKPTGISSAKALYPVKRLFPGQKIGHTGTLDPFAAGLLVVLVGQATRLSRLFLTLDKRYVATVRFGRETDTHDPEGSTVREAPLPNPEAVSRMQERFIGTIEQIPPRYSALKVNGKRSYELARSGTDHSLPARPVTVYDLGLVQQTEDTFEMSVHCGSGTYIRALARDIGRASGSAAYVETLIRTAVGPFLLSDMRSVKDGETEELISIADAIIRLGSIPIIPIPDSGAERMRHGVQPEHAIDPAVLTEMTGTTYALCVTEERDAVALLERHADQSQWRFAAVFPAEDAE